MADHHDGHINLVVVVSGVPRAERAELAAPLSHLVEHVLKESGDQGRHEDDFELRTEDGRQLNLQRSAREEGLHEGQTLFLNPRAGAGG